MISNQDQYVFWKDTFFQDKFPAASADSKFKVTEVTDDMPTNRIFEPAHSPEWQPDNSRLSESTPFVPLEEDPNGKAQNEPGAKVDAGKNRVWLCVSGFSNALEEVSRITTIGASKYTPNGWVEVPDGQTRYMDAFGRHLLSLGKGEVYDNGPGGTGGMHLSQAIWNLLAVLELQLRDKASQKNI